MARARTRLATLAVALLVGLSCRWTAAQPAPPAPLAEATTPTTLPAEAFFLPGRLREVRLSPAGRWLAAVTAQPGERARLVVSDLDEKEPAKVVAAFSKFDVHGVRWINEDLLIFSVENPDDQSSDALRKRGGLLSVQRDGERMRLLIKREWDSSFPPQGNAPLEANHSLLAHGGPESDDIIVGEWLFDAADNFTALRPLRLNTRTGARTSLVDDAPPHTQHWWFDHLGRPRVAAARFQGTTTVFWRDARAGSWREVLKAPSLDLPWWPAFVDGEGQLYVTRSSAKDEGQLLRVNPSTGKPEGEAVAVVPGFSPSFEEQMDGRSGELLGLQVLTDAATQVWMRPALQAVHARANALLPGRVNLLDCGACSDPRRVLVHSYSDRHPGEYLLHDMKAGTWQRLGSVRPAIVPEQMGRLDLHRIQARDGADLPVWITLPPGPARGRRPAVVLVHGGPWLRGAEWAWDDASQFLATRGYVVIQPEFRGSSGYGRGHFEAGFRQWGQAMQDDVSDALKFAVDKGWVDPGRVCIAGGSYGGYSTLMGLAKDPALYRCGVAWVAVTDPRLMYTVHWSDLSNESKQHSMPQMVGDPVKDAAMLAANAPVNLADRIRSPVMLVYGSLDRRVPITHGEQMRAALERAGNPPQWHVYGNEGHTWRRPTTRVDFWRRVETFLAAHLKP